MATAGALALLVLAAGSCAGDGPTGLPPAVASLEVSPGADTLLALGRIRTFTAVAKDADGDVISNPSLHWRSSDSLIARVDSLTGVVTAVAGGLATISAVSGTVEGSGTVAVIQVVAGVTVTPGEFGLTAIGATTAFTAVARDSSNAVVPGVRFLWLSSDPSVATIDTLGVARAVGAGVVTISASGRGVPAYAELTVEQEATQLAFTVLPTDVRAGASFETALQVEVRDAAGVLVPSARIPITIGLSENPGDATLWGSKTVGSIGGVATFSGLWLNRSAAGYELFVSAPGLAPDTSGTFDVAPGPVATYSVTVGALGEAGHPSFAATLQFRDAHGNAADTTLDMVFYERAGVAEFYDVGSSAPPQELGPGMRRYAALELPRPGSAVQLLASTLIDGQFVTATSEPFNLHATFTGLSAGVDHMCGIAPGGAFCWGGNAVRQLGTKSFFNTQPDSVPLAVHFEGTQSRIAASASRTCAIVDAGAIRCWGGTGSTEILAGTGAGGVQFTEITVGTSHACALTAGGAVYCWGSGNSGQLGQGSFDDSNTPVQVLGSGSGDLVFTQIDAGYLMTCGVTTAGRAYCWGYNGTRQLGDGTTNHSNVPIQAVGTGTGQLILVKVSAGNNSSCAITTEGNLACWGGGPLGDGTGSFSLVPIITFDGTVDTPVTDVSVGAQHTCAVRAAALHCWGYNTSGQVGPGAVLNQLSPMSVSVSGRVVLDVEAGHDFTCARTSGGVYCWGSNEFGKLGIGSTDPAIVTIPTRIRQ